MEIMEGTFDLGFDLVREKIRLGFLLYRSWEWRYEKVQDFGRKSPQTAHSRMAVLVLVSVVPVPRVYCRVWLGWYWYQ